MRRFGLLFLAVVVLGPTGTGTLRAQDDLDSLDKWVREMHPDPFLRCGESAWIRQLDVTREQWLKASSMERIRMVNLLLQTMQDSHSAVSAYDWIWEVERLHGTLPIRWAIEGRALWVLDSGLPGLPEEVRVIDLNGRAASDVVQDALDLSTMEGPSLGATARMAAHNITPWVLGTSDTSALALTWLDPDDGLPTTRTFQAQGRRKARSGWAEISTRRPVVSWSFPDGDQLTARDNRRQERENKRLASAGRPRRVQTHWTGAATLKISSFSQGSWSRYHKRLRKGMERLQELQCPLIVDLRGNPGGQSPRMEMLWNHLALKRTHLPYALVAKQSLPTARANGRYYKRLRKRWVDKHRHHSSDARYIYTMATLPLGETDTLFFPQKGVPSHGFRGPVAVVIDGESASASVSFAGAIQDEQRGPLIGESCMGPSNGTMGNPYIRMLPRSGIAFSLSTAVYMAKPCENWGDTAPIQPDVHVPAMWKRNSALSELVQQWIDAQHHAP